MPASKKLNVYYYFTVIILCISLLTKGFLQENSGKWFVDIVQKGYRDGYPWMERTFSQKWILWSHSDYDLMTNLWESWRKL